MVFIIMHCSKNHNDMVIHIDIQIFTLKDRVVLIQVVLDNISTVLNYSYVPTKAQSFVLLISYTVNIIG